MRRRVTIDRSGCTTVRLGAAEHGFAVAVPDPQASLADQIAEAIALGSQLNCQAVDQGAVVHHAVFLAQRADEAVCREALTKHHGGTLPPTSWINQPPCDGQRLVIESWLAGPVGAGLEIKSIDDDMALITQGDLKLFLCADARPRPGTTGVFNETASALSQLRARLARAGFGFDHILRTWFYLGGIVDPEGDTQRYKELNRARGAFYDGVHFLADCRPPGSPSDHVFPASTGIGASDREVRIAAIGLAGAAGSFRATPIENPHQQSAFEYARRYSPTSPQFARAMALHCQSATVVLVSGTASITHAESMHGGDPRAQTELTLDNIAALIDGPNLARHQVDSPGCSLHDLVEARVYIKRRGDYETIRRVCDDRLPDLDKVYVLTDVCRPELLVEIEGVAIPGASS